MPSVRLEPIGPDELREASRAAGSFAIMVSDTESCMYRAGSGLILCPRGLVPIIREMSTGTRIVDFQADIVRPVHVDPSIKGRKSERSKGPTIFGDRTQSWRSQKPFWRRS